MHSHLGYEVQQITTVCVSVVIFLFALLVMNTVMKVEEVERWYKAMNDGYDETDDWKIFCLFLTGRLPVSCV